MELEKEHPSHTLGVFVANKPGVLVRVAQVFARRGFNIDSLVVSSARDGQYSRMTITSLGKTEDFSNIVKNVEKFVAVTGNGWSGQAKQTHERHEEYARKTLYAYMPCADLSGVEYVDAVVRHYFNGNYGYALYEFVSASDNVWCPKWIRRNYEIQNKISPN